MPHGPRSCTTPRFPRTVCRAASLAVGLALGALLSASVPLAAFAESGDRPDSSGPSVPAVDPNDPCGVQHAALRESDDFFDRQILQAFCLAY